MTRGLLLLLAAACAPAALAQAPPAAGAPSGQAAGETPWRRSGPLIMLDRAGIGVPAAPAGLQAKETLEFSRKGEALDAAVKYASADGAINATAYVYLPGLAHTGLASVSTDNAIRSTSTTPVGGGEMRLAGAGAVAGAAIRRDYSNYRGSASSAAFVKAGRWLIKLRVSGPEERKAEVARAMDALLEGLRVGDGTPLHPARPIAVSDCTEADLRTSGRMLADPPGAEMAAHAILATMDGGGWEARDKETGKASFLPPRIPEAMCRSRSAAAQQVPTPILRAASAQPVAMDGVTRLIVILSDSGETLELVQSGKLGRSVLLHHAIGRTELLSGWDGVPSDEQILALLRGSNQEAVRVRAGAVFTPKGAEIHLAPPPPAPPTT